MICVIEKLGCEYLNNFMNNKSSQTKLQRIILLTVLAYEAWGGITGGMLLMTSPDGSSMKMPVEMMHGVFSNFLVPGIILHSMGLLTAAALIAVWTRAKIDWLLAGLVLVGFTIWFAVEIAILGELHWLHIMWGVPVLVGIWAALPLIPRFKTLLK